jgi:hypothetical protein
MADIPCAYEKWTASGFQKAFGHLLAKIIGASSALQHVYSPWLGHFQLLLRGY